MAQIVQDDRRLVGARVDPQVREQLFALARREDRSVSSVVRRALVREIERDHDEEEAWTTTQSTASR